MKRPAFQFYPGDWLRDTALRSCSVAGRGVWIDLLCYMHDGAPYGHLAVAGEAIPERQLAQMVGLPYGRFKTLLQELEHAKVFERTTDATIYSRRMVRDEAIQEKRAAGGIKSIEHPNTPKPKGTLRGTLQGSHQGHLEGAVGGPPPASAVASAVAGETKSSSLSKEGNGPPPQTQDPAYAARCCMAVNRALARRNARPYKSLVPTRERDQATAWERDGIPVALVERVLAERTDAYRGPGQPNSLRYFDAAVRETWAPNRAAGRVPPSPTEMLNRDQILDLCARSPLRVFDTTRIPHELTRAKAEQLIRELLNQQAKQDAIEQHERLRGIAQVSKREHSEGNEVQDEEEIA